jgi:hypothetical protein
MKTPLPGRRVKVPQLIEGVSRGVPFIVRIMVEGVILDEADGELSFEPQAVRVLDEAQRLANAGDLASLERFGEVFVRKSA